MPPAIDHTLTPTCFFCVCVCWSRCVRVFIQHANVLGPLGWTTVVAAVVALLDAHLLPPRLLVLEDFVAGAPARTVPWNHVDKRTAAAAAARRDTPTFFSFFLYSDADEPEAVDTQTPAFATAADCVLRYHVPELLTESRCGR
jgi:hypothetical protein